MSKIKSIPWDGKSPALYAHLKIDGAFLRIIKNELGDILCLSSLDIDLTNQIKACKPKWFVNLQKNMPYASSVIGEIYYHNVENKCGMPASYIKTGLSNAENYFELESNSTLDKRTLGKIHNNSFNQLCFAAFAIEYGFDGIHLASDLEEVQINILKLGIEFAPFISFRYTRGQFLEKYNKELLLGTVLQEFVEEHKPKGLAEGWMLKNGNLTGWKKVKKENTIDCFITGYVPGQGKYSGKVGSLRCAVYNSAGNKIEIATVGGFSDEIRDWLTDQFADDELRENILKQVIEVQYQFVATKGRLRHPRFKNWRDDKLPEECLTNQDLDLENYWD